MYNVLTKKPKKTGSDGYIDHPIIPERTKKESRIIYHGNIYPISKRFLYFQLIENWIRVTG